VRAWFWLDAADAKAVHERSLILHGGAQGLRDEGLLESAMARPRQLAAYDEGADLIDLAASYTFGIVRNHPFIDGNKRTGFVLGVLFLEHNGLRFIASEEAATAAMLSLAAGEMDESGFVSFLRENVAR
jgi:death on curing protein